MSRRSILRTALGAALLVNAVPHGVAGVQGKPFPSPFADPPGVGTSPPAVNLGWSALNAVAGALLLRRGIRSVGEAVAASAAALAMASVLAFHFGDLSRGGQGLRGLGKDGSGPPRALVRATEPVAGALAGRRWMPLWAIIHHRGRRSGTGYATPIAVIPTLDPSIILIGLPWGADTNWAQNVVAAGSARLTWRGREHAVVTPRIVEESVAADLAKPFARFIVRRMPAAIVLERG
jgi:deazaflavin-dependent oxidoreductase (nitroreductase family)